MNKLPEGPTRSNTKPDEPVQKNIVVKPRETSSDKPCLPPPPPKPQEEKK